MLASFQVIEVALELSAMQLDLSWPLKHILALLENVTMTREWGASNVMLERYSVKFFTSIFWEANEWRGSQRC